MAEKRIDRIDEEIAALKAELQAVRGTDTEVYTRIVGYYRSVKNWNKGKREEYGQRVVFDSGKAVSAAIADEKAIAERAKGLAVEKAVAESVSGDPKAYLLFVKDLCPNCPPVKAYVSDLGIDGVHVDVGTEDGLSAARRYGVMASPTVIFFDEEKNELFRANTLNDLKKRMGTGVSA